VRCTAGLAQHVPVSGVLLERVEIQGEGLFEPPGRERAIAILDGIARAKRRGRPAVVDGGLGRGLRGGEPVVGLRDEQRQRGDQDTAEGHDEMCKSTDRARHRCGERHADHQSRRLARSMLDTRHAHHRSSPRPRALAGHCGVRPMTSAPTIDLMRIGSSSFRPSCRDCHRIRSSSCRIELSSREHRHHSCPASRGRAGSRRKCCC